MLKIKHSARESQRSHSSDADTLHKCHSGGTFTAIDCADRPPLPDAFLLAVEQNNIHYASRQGKRRYASPFFKLVQCLKSYPELKGCTGEEAFRRLNNEVKPDWERLFPHVSVPSLEFETAWEQVNIPAGESPMAVIEDRVINAPLTLLHTPTCEGYEHYLGIAYHFQRLMPRGDILLPVGPLSCLLAKLMGKPITEQAVSNYSGKARRDGYIKLTASAHHPSKKAARYRFDLKRFTEAGVEIDLNSEKGRLADSNFSYGIDGTQDIDGSDGSEVENCVQTHAYDDEQTSSKSIQEENIERYLGDIEGKKMLEEDSVRTILRFVKVSTKKTKVMPFPSPPTSMDAETPMPASERLEVMNNTKPVQNAIGYRLAMLWQERLSAQEPAKYHKPLTKVEVGMLGHVGRCVGEKAMPVIEFVLGHWGSFVRAAMIDRGLFGSQPEAPTVPFFAKYHDTAVNMMQQVIAEEKAHTEHQALLARQHAEAAKQQPDAQAMSNSEAEKPHKLSDEEFYEILNSL